MIRRGLALPAALAAMGVLAALAALANVAARAAINEASALHAEAQSDLARRALRARVTVALARTGRAALLVAPPSIAGADTVLVVDTLAWPWHRVAVTVAGTPVVAELARSRARLPWCAAVVAGGAVLASTGALSLGPGSGCAAPLIATTADSIGVFADSLAHDLPAAAIPDSVLVAGVGAGVVVRARRCVVVAAGASVLGLIVAPIVRIAPAASVRGMVIARDTLVVAPAAAVQADETAATEALRANARLLPVGRRGLLLP